MREFRLRAYDTQCRHMCSVTRIDTDMQGNIDGIGLISYKDLHQRYDGQYYITDCTHIKLKEIILMQYIGRKDKNNKPIYEDDIVKTKWQYCGVTNWDFEFIGKVFYRLEHCAFRILSSDNHFSRPLYNENSEKLLSIEVIGNVYENPGILQGSVKNDI